MRPRLRKLAVQGSRELGYMVYDAATGEKVSPAGEATWSNRHRASQARDELEQAEHVDYAIGPRHVGGRYHCGYWRHDDTVLAIDRPADGPWRITEATDEEAANGRSRTHCTSWDWGRDKVISQPEATDA